MKAQRKRLLLLLGPTVLFGIALLFVLACEPTLPLRIENRTATALTIYIQEQKTTYIEPDKIVKVKGIPGTLTHCLIEAKNERGELIYSRKFSIDELHDANWKVVISSPK